VIGTLYFFATADFVKNIILRDDVYMLCVCCLFRKPVSIPVPFSPKFADMVELQMVRISLLFLYVAVVLYVVVVFYVLFFCVACFQTQICQPKMF
jgi:hypothetical protein